MVTLEINGIPRTDVLATASLQVEKLYGAETAQFLVRSRQGDYEPLPNDELLIYHNSDLLFGGLCVAVGQRKHIDGVGLAVQVDGRDFSIVLDRTVVGSLTIPAGTSAAAAMFALFETYLAPKGFTWISDEDGGPTTITELVFDHQPLSAVFNEVAAQVEGYWRTNGLKQTALVFPGDLVGDEIVDDDVLEPDIHGDDTLEQEVATQANRLFIRTGGSGVVQHSEARTGDGVQTRFHLNVEPRPDQDDPPVSYAPTTVTENGTPYTIGGGRWAYDADEHAVYVASGGPPAIGHAIVVGPYEVEYPAWARVWTGDAVNADGTWDLTTTSDAIVQAQDKTHIVQAVEWGRLVLVRRSDAAKVLRLSTYKPGYYPILQVSVNRAARGVVATYLVVSVNAYGTELDPAVTDDDVLYQLELVEGNHLGPNFRDAWLARGGNTTGGTSVLGGSVPGAVAPAPPASGSTVGYPVGHTQPLGGDNYNAYTATTTWQDWPHFPPTRHGGPGMAGDWLLRTPMYQMSAGTLEARLINQADSSVIASTSTTQTGTLTNQNWAFETDAYAAPSSVLDVILQFRVTSGSRKVKLGQATLVKTS